MMDPRFKSLISDKGMDDGGGEGKATEKEIHNIRAIKKAQFQYNQGIDSGNFSIQKVYYATFQFNKERNLFIRFPCQCRMALTMPKESAGHMLCHS